MRTRDMYNGDVSTPSCARSHSWRRWRACDVVRDVRRHAQAGVRAAEADSRREQATPTWLLWCTFHGVCLARARRSVGKDSDVHSAQRARHVWGHCGEDVLLGRVRWENTRESVPMDLKKRLMYYTHVPRARRSSQRTNAPERRLAADTPRVGKHKGAVGLDTNSRLRVLAVQRRANSD